MKFDLISMADEFYQKLRTWGSITELENCSHIWCDDPPTFFKIESTKKRDLHLEYCRLVNEGQQLLLAEKRMRESPVSIELMLTFNQRDIKNQEGKDIETYDDTLIFNIIYHIQHVLSSLLRVQTDEDLRCIVLESEPYQIPDTEFVRTDMRFHFPRCKVDGEYQEDFLMSAIVDRLNAARIEHLFFVTPEVVDWSQMVAEYDDVLLMFGSVRSQWSSPALFSAVIGRITPQILEAHDPELSQDIEFYFPPSEHRMVSLGIMEEDEFSREVPGDYWLPVILSTDYHQHPTVSKTSIQGQNQLQEDVMSLSQFGRGIVEDIDKAELAKIFISMWPTNRGFVYSEWKKVGEAIYDAFQGGREGLQLWCEWTCRMTDTYSELEDGASNTLVDLYDNPTKCCGDIYKTFVTERTTIKTLAFFIRESDPKSYQVWHRNWCRKSLEQGISGNHYDVARAFYRLYWLEYMCACGGKTPIWYYFDRHRLRQTPRGIELLVCISTKFHDVYRDMRRDIMKLNRGANESDDKGAENIITSITRLMQNLKNHGYKQSILSELSQFYLNYDLDRYLDDNLELIGLPNGVIVADDTGAIVRGGHPEDYITRTTAVPYHKDYSYSHPQVREVMDWFGKLFVDVALLAFFLRWASSVLRGGNNDKKIPCFTGKGDNSKSMMVRFFEYILGDYVVKLMISIATNARGDPNAPSPALARLKGARLVWLEEPEKGVPMQVSLLKQFSGFDRYYARMLKKNGGDIDPSFKSGIVCNDIPPMPNAVDDKAMKNRFIVMPCMSTWVTNPPESIEEQRQKRLFKVDRFFDKRIKELAAAGLWVLVSQYNSSYIPEKGLGEIPPIVQQVTKEYWDRNDTYHQFISSNYTKVEDPTDRSQKVTVESVYSNFKSWYRNCYPGNRVVDRPTMVEALTARWGTVVLGSWYGYRLSSNSEESSENKGTNTSQ